MKLLRTLLAIVCAAMLCSCGTRRYAPLVKYERWVQFEESETAPGKLPPLFGEDASVVIEAYTWVGTPYRYGGEDRDGVDCSGLVKQVFYDAIGRQLPRTSHDQAAISLGIDIEQLKPGDLLFYATGGRRSTINHVGIYVGYGKMVHASSSSGVIETSISQPYFVARFAKAGRVLTRPEEE